MQFASLHALSLVHTFAFCLEEKASYCLSACLQNTGSNRRSTLNCLPYLIWASQSSEQSMGLYYFITHTLWSGFWKQGLVLAQVALEFTVLLHWPVKYRYKCAPLQLLLHTLNVMRFLKTMMSQGIEPFFLLFYSYRFSDFVPYESKYPMSIGEYFNLTSFLGSFKQVLFLF